MNAPRAVLDTLVAASVGWVLILTSYAWVVYLRAVAHGHRAYTHIVFSTSFVFVIEWVAVTSVEHGSAQAWALLIANALAGVAMFTLAGRFQ